MLKVQQSGVPALFQPGAKQKFNVPDEAGNYPQTTPLSPDQQHDLIMTFRGKMIDFQENVLIDAGDQQHFVYQMSNFLAFFGGAKKFTSALSLTKTLAAAGRVTVKGTEIGLGAAAVANTNAALAAFVAQSEDENLISMFSAGGVPRNEFLKMLAFNEDHNPLVNRLKNATVEWLAGMALDPVIEYVRGIYGTRKGIFEIAEKQAAAGDDSLKVALDNALTKAEIERKELLDIMGDPDGDFFNARPLTESRQLKPGFGVQQGLPDTGLEPVEAANSLVLRAENPTRVAEELSTRTNWSRINGPDDMLRVQSDVMDTLDPEVARVIGGVRTLDQAIEESIEINPFHLIMDGVGTDPMLRTLTDAEVVAMRDFRDAAAFKVLQIAKLLHHSGQTDMREVAFNKMFGILRESQRQISGAQASASRTLGAFRAESSAFRIPGAGRKGAPLIKDIEELVYAARADGTEVTAQIAGDLVKLMEGQAGASRVSKYVDAIPGLRSVVKHGGDLGNALKASYFFALLTRVNTLIRIGASGTSRFGMELADRGLANKIAKIGGMENAPFAGEPAAFLIGGLKGLGDAFRFPHMVDYTKGIVRGEMPIDSMLPAALDALNGGVPGAFLRGRANIGVDRMEPLLGAFSPEVWGASPGGKMALSLHIVNGGMSVGTRSMAAVDQAVKMTMHRAEAQALATRQALREVQEGTLDPAHLSRRVEHIASNPTDAMLVSMNRLAAEATATQKPPNGARMWNFLKAARELPVIGVMLMPFTTAPYNTAWELLRHSPAAPFMKTAFRDEVTSGDARRETLAMARMGVGSMALLAAMDLIHDNDRIRIHGVTNDPTQFPRSKQQKRLGIYGASIEVATTSAGFAGNTYSFGLRGFEPIAGPLLMAAQLSELLKSDQFDADNEEHIALILNTVGAAAAILTSSTMLDGFREGMDVANDPMGKTSKYLGNAAITLASPGAISQLLPVTDVHMRTVFDQWDKFKSKTPGLSNDLQPAVDAWGRDILRQPGYQGILSAAVPRLHPADQKMEIDLWLEANDEVISVPDKKSITFGGVEIKWADHPAAYTEYVRLQGRTLVDIERSPAVAIAKSAGLIRLSPPELFIPLGVGLGEELNALTAKPGRANPTTQRHFDSLTPGEDGEQAEYIRTMVTYYRAAARAIILNDPQFSDLLGEVQDGLDTLAVETRPGRSLGRIQEKRAVTTRIKARK